MIDEGRGQELGAPATDDILRDAAIRWQIPQIDISLLRHALTHSSAVGARSPESNERLEFLGDSILNAAIAEELFRRNSDFTEGDLAKARALVVSKLALYAAGVRLGISNLIHLGSNNEGVLARSRRSMTADAVEAVIAAVYLHFGWERARAFTLEILSVESDSLRVRQDLRDAKTILQERAQASGGPPPTYRTVAESGYAHDRLFTCEVSAFGVTAVGVGRAKKDAQREAAKAAVVILDGG